jgi:hypothetical protein
MLNRLVASFDRLGEPDLVVFRKERVLPDIGEVQTDEVFIISFNAIFGHRRLPLVDSRSFSAADVLCASTPETNVTIPTAGPHPT